MWVLQLNTVCGVHYLVSVCALGKSPNLSELQLLHLQNDSSSTTYLKGEDQMT